MLRPAVHHAPSHPGPGRARAPSRRGGVTLVELVVVLVIVAVLAGMAAPQMAGAWGSATLRSSARDLLLAARYARAVAVMHRTHARLILSASDGRYWIEARGLDGSDRQPGFARLATPHGRVRSLGSGVRFTAVRVQPRGASGSAVDGGGTAIVFEPTGESDTAVIGLGDGRGWWTLRVAPSTGRVELVEGEALQPVDDREDLDR